MTFKHSETHTLTASDYADIYALGSRKQRVARFIALGAFGVVLLFNAYTLILGIVILVLSILFIVMPQLVPGTLARSFSEHKHLHLPITYTVSNEELAVVSDQINLRCKWPNAQVWSERDGWFRISPHGMQHLYFKTASLKDASVYDTVLDLCQKHGKEFDA